MLTFERTRGLLFVTAAVNCIPTLHAFRDIPYTKHMCGVIRAKLLQYRRRRQGWSVASPEIACAIYCNRCICADFRCKF